MRQTEEIIGGDISAPKMRRTECIDCALPPNTKMQWEALDRRERMHFASPIFIEYLISFC